jgi:adenine-specific DNA-methyltransferase
MMAKKTKKPVKVTPVEAHKHKDARVNIPTQELRHFVAEDEKKPATLLYPRDPSLDPQLVWKGKDEQDRQDLAVPVVPVYIQEKIHPQALVENLRDTAQKGEPEPELALFADFNGIGDFDKKVDFYHHEGHWSNRMILGDSLLVMASLAEKEGLKGKVQCIYFDPPYGIKFGSNWQVSTRKRDVKDGKAEDATRQPEQVRAFRDTWQLGIHSYLAYLRERLVAARDLLTETGSVFVQIGDQNVHLVRALLDEVFGAENFCNEVFFQKTGSSTSKYLQAVPDILLWYARDLTGMKYRALSIPKYDGDLREDVTPWLAETEAGPRRLTEHELANPAVRQGLRVFQPGPVNSQHPSKTRSGVFRFQGEDFSPPPGRQWTHDPVVEMPRLVAAGRLVKYGNTLRGKMFVDDAPARELTNVWLDTQLGGFSLDQVYVVQTSTKCD